MLRPEITGITQLDIQSGKGASSCSTTCLSRWFVRDAQGGSESMMAISVHKFVLAISNPVFFTMFYGEIRREERLIQSKSLTVSITTCWNGFFPFTAVQ